MDFRQDQLQDLRASEHKNTYIWDLVVRSLPLYLVHLSQNVLLLRRSKEAANKDRKERGIKFNDYLETTDYNTYNDKEDVNIDIDFATLLPTQHHLLQAALDVRGDVNHGTSRLRVLLNPLNTSTHFCKCLWYPMLFRLIHLVFWVRPHVQFCSEIASCFPI